MSNNILFKQGNQCLVSPFHMDERSKTIGRNVARYRAAADMSQAELAKAIGVKSQNTIAAIETGATQESKHLPKIARVLRVRVADLDPAYQGEESVTMPLPKSGEAEDFEIFSSVECGDGAIVLSNEPFQMVKRPEPLIGVRGGYGLLVTGDSMIPVIRPGVIVLINPHLPARVGDHCLFVYEGHGEFRATLKEYCGQTADKWLVKRYHPKERRFSLDRAQWTRCEVVVGQHYRR